MKSTMHWCGFPETMRSKNDSRNRPGLSTHVEASTPVRLFGPTFVVIATERMHHKQARRMPVPVSDCHVRGLLSMFTHATDTTGSRTPDGQQRNAPTILENDDQATARLWSLAFYGYQHHTPSVLGEVQALFMLQGSFKWQAQDTRDRDV